MINISNLAYVNFSRGRVKVPAPVIAHAGKFQKKRLWKRPELSGLRGSN